MSTCRFLADEDVRHRIVLAVKRREPAIEFLTVQEVGLSERPDPEVLDFAAKQELIVVSHDVNTMSDAAYDRVVRGNRMTGLLLIPQSRQTRPAVESLILIWALSSADEWLDQVKFLPI
jgi:predicted nuclease of predicted toxin-antitoxin system